MEKLDQFIDAVKKVNEAAVELQEELVNSIFEKSPIIVHQKFCHELGEIMERNPTKIPRDIPEAVDVLTALDVLERLYPQVKKKAP